MGLEISKHYSYSFHLMSARLYEDINYHGTIFFSGNWPSLKNFNFDMTLIWESIEKPKM